jgi:hypothetical protein
MEIRDKPPQVFVVFTSLKLFAAGPELTPQPAQRGSQNLSHNSIFKEQPGTRLSGHSVKFFHQLRSPPNPRDKKTETPTFSPGRPSQTTVVGRPTLPNSSGVSTLTQNLFENLFSTAEPFGIPLITNRLPANHPDSFQRTGPQQYPIPIPTQGFSKIFCRFFAPHSS